MPAHHKDYYGILQVNRTARPEEIRAAYRRLSLKYHPDTNKAPDATARMQEINEAYDVLRNSAKRSWYDWSRTPGSWEAPEDEGAQRRETAEAERRRGDWEKEESDEAAEAQRRAADEQKRAQAEARRHNATPQRKGGCAVSPVWWEPAMFTLFWLIINLFRGVTATSPAYEQPAPAPLPAPQLSLGISQVTYHVSYLDQGIEPEGPHQGTRKQALTLSIRNANWETYCANAWVYFDAGGGAEKTTWLPWLGVAPDETWGNDWRINGLPYRASALLVPCGGGANYGIILNAHQTVDLTISTYQLPKFPAESPHPLRITRIHVWYLIPWNPGSRQDLETTPLNLPIAEGQ